MMDENMIVIIDPKRFCFSFDWPKDVDENLKHKIETIIKKSNESLAQNEITNKVEQLLSKYETDVDPRNVAEIIIPPEIKRRNIKRIKTSIIKMERYKISKLLNNSTLPKFMTKLDRSTLFIKW